MSDFEFIVIEKVVNESEGQIDKRWLTREAFWCSQLCTLQPQASIKDSNSIQKIELGLIDVFYALLAIFV